MTVDPSLCSAEPEPPAISRRKWIKRGLGGAAALTFASGSYPFLEARWCRVSRQTIGIRKLPQPFAGLKVALLSDTHHGPFVSIAYLKSVVALANSLKPDLVVLGGDYVHKHPKYIGPGIAVLGALEAPLGRVAVLGNHDNWEDHETSRGALADAKLQEITNTGVWLERGGARLRVAGVGDLWTDVQVPDAAVGDATERDAVILVSHNPDTAEYMPDPRISLMLSGHTHGGQVVLPGYGAPIVPSAFGQKYIHGLVQGPAYPVYVTRGVGTVTPPVRFRCRPEVALLTLETLA